MMKERGRRGRDADERFAVKRSQNPLNLILMIFSCIESDKETKEI